MSRTSKKSRNSLKSERSFSEIGPKTSVDNKLTHTSMLLNYQFEWGVDFRNRIINITGEIDETQFEVVDAALTAMESESKQKVTIKINSPGGETYQAMAIIGRMKESKCHIVTKGYGHIMSAAALILAAGDKRMMSEIAVFMWHESSYGLEGRHSEMKANVAQAEREEELWAEQMAECSERSIEYWKKHGVHTDAYFKASELLEMSVIDELF